MIVYYAGILSKFVKYARMVVECLKKECQQYTLQSIDIALSKSKKQILRTDNKSTCQDITFK